MSKVRFIQRVFIKSLTSLLIASILAIPGYPGVVMANDGSTPPKAIPVNSQTQSQSGNKTLNQLGKIGVNAATGAGRNVVSSLASGNTSNLGSSAINGAISGATGSGGINVSNLFGGGGSGGSGFSLGGSGGAAAGGNFASSAGSSVGSAVGSALGGSTGSAIGGILGGFVQGILSLLGGIGSIIMIVIQLISSLFSGGSGGGSSGGSGGQNGLQQAVGSLGSNVNSLGDAAGQILGGAGDLLGLNTRPEQAAFGYGGTNTGQRSNLFGSLSNGNNNLLGGLVKAGLGYAATQSDNQLLQTLGAGLLGSGANDILGAFTGGGNAGNSTGGYGNNGYNILTNGGIVDPNSVGGGNTPQRYIATSNGLTPVAGNGTSVGSGPVTTSTGQTISTQEIDRAFRGYRSVDSNALASALPSHVQHLADDFVRVGQQTNVDPLLLVSIARQETGFNSRHLREKNNIMGSYDSSKGDYRTFATVADSIAYQANQLNTNSAYDGVNTLRGLWEKYAPPPYTNGGKPVYNDPKNLNRFWGPDVASHLRQYEQRVGG